MPSHLKISQNTADILAGEEDLSLWDDEELRKGYRRDRNGTWRGRPPSIIPAAVHTELVRRTFSKANLEMLDNLGKAVETLVELLDDADSTVRLKASAIIIERIMGKTPVKLDVSVIKAKWEEALSASVITIAQLEDGIIDVESDEIEDPDYDPFL